MAVTAAPPPSIQISTVMSTFDQKSDTYTGYVRVIASPRPGVTFDVALQFQNAKTEKDALAQVKTSLDKVTGDIRESAAAPR